MILGTMKNVSSRAGAFASAASGGRPGRSSSARSGTALGEGVGHRLDPRDVELGERCDVIEDRGELAGEGALLVGRKPEPRQRRDAPDLVEREGHVAPRPASSSRA